MGASGGSLRIKGFVSFNLLLPSFRGCHLPNDFVFSWALFRLQVQ